MCKKYSKKENKSFLRQIEEGKSIEEVRIPGRKKAQIRRRAREKGLMIKRIIFPPLTRKQRKKLRQLIANGFTPWQIAEGQLLGKEKNPRNENNIRKWMGRLRLVNKNRSRAAKKRKFFEPKEKRTFDNFLRKHSTKLSVRQIARKFGMKRATVGARQRKLGVKPPYSVVLKIPGVRRRIRAGNKKRGKKMLAEFDDNIKIKEAKILASREKMAKNNSQGSSLLQKRKCKKCGRVFFKHTDFFYHSDKKHNGYTSRSFSGICIICWAKKKHQEKLKQP